MDPKFIYPSIFRFAFGSVQIDLTKSFSEVFKAVNTRHTIEKGTSLVNHRFFEPNSIEFEGKISDVPIGNLGSMFNGMSKKGRAKEIFDELLALHASYDTFEVISGFHHFESMQFTRLSPGKDKPFFGLVFSASIEQIRFAEISGANAETMDLEEVDEAIARVQIVTAAHANFGTASPAEFKDIYGILA